MFNIKRAILIPAMCAGFAMSAGATAAPSPFSAAAGAAAGSVRLDWTVTDTLAAGDTYYVQFSTFPSFAWSTATAQIMISTASGLTGPQVLVVGGLDIGHDGSGAGISPTYYFRAWIYSPSNGGLSTDSSASAAANTPSAIPQSSAAYNGGAVNLIPGLYTWKNAVANDALGNFYMVSGSSSDVILNKYAADGLLQWSKRYNGQSDQYEEAHGLALDPAGNIYVVGTEYDPVTSGNFLILKYNPAGEMVWRKYYDGAVHQYDQAYGVAVDSSGYVYVAGAEDAGGNRNYDIRLLKYNQSGVVVSSRIYANNGYDYAYGVAVDNGGNVYVAGALYNGLDNDIALLKFAPSGTLDWVRTNPNSGYEQGNGVAVDNFGGIYEVGTVDAYNLSQSGNIWLRKYDSQGNALWTQTYNDISNNYDEGQGVAVDNAGNVYAVGSEYKSGEGNNIWLRKYAPNGQILMTQSINSASNQYDTGFGVAVSSAGVICVTGQFDGGIAVLRIPQAVGTVPSLSASQGSYTGSVNLSWPFKDGLPAGSTYYVQYSAVANAFWLPANAQISVPVPAALPTFTGWSHEVSGLTASRDGYGNLTSPPYYFKVWISSAPGIYTALANITTGYARTPFIADSDMTLPDGRLNFAANAYAAKAPLARDSSGNVYLAFGGYLGGGDYGYALRKYNSAGVPLWTRFYNSTAAVNAQYEVNDIKVDAAGNIYAAGSELRYDIAQGENAFVRKHSSSGDLIWAAVYNGADNSSDKAYGLAVDNSGNVYVSGFYTRAAEGANGLLLKYNSSGVQQWVRTEDLNGSAAGSQDILYSVALNAAGSGVYVAGQKTDLNGADVYVAGYSSAGGVPAFTDQYDGAGHFDDMAYAIEVSTATGEFYVAGSETVTGENRNIWVRKYAAVPAAGGVWTRSYNSIGNGNDEAFGLAVDGALYAVGKEDRGDIGQMDDLWIRKYNISDGSTVWTKTFNSLSVSTGSESGTDVSADASGNVYVGMTAGGSPGLYKFSPPYFGLSARPGGLPASAEVYWTTDAELPPGSTCYVQYSTYSAGMAWDFTGARILSVTTQTIMSGSLQTLSVPNLDAGRNGAGTAISPLYYFRAWYRRPSEAAVAVTGAPSSQANTPAVSDNSVTYTDSKVFSISQNYGWRNRIARAPGGYLYMVSNQYFSAAAGGVTGGSAMVLRKYNPDMSVAWTKFFGAGENENVEGKGLALDASGNIYVAGSKGKWDSASGQDIMVAKYTPAGERLWFSTYDHSNQYDYGYGIVAGDFGGAYVIGNVGKSDWTQDIFIGKVAADGVFLGSVTVNGAGGNSYDEGNAIAFDPASGSVFAAGSVAQNGESGNIWLARYDDGLAFQSSMTINGAASGQDSAYGVAADGLGNAYVVGAVNDVVSQGNDIFVGKFDPSCNALWTRVYNDPGNQYDSGYGVALDEMGGVYVVGSESRWDINQGDNLFIRKYNASGDTLWTRSFNAGASSYEAGFDVAVDSAGYVYVGGTFNNGYGIYRYKQLIFSGSNPMLTVYVSSTVPMAGAGVVILPFAQTGGVDPELISTGTTNADGMYALRLPPGFQYFIGISTPGYKPTIKDQMMDPYGSFMVTLKGDTTKQYRLFSRSASEPAYTLNLAISSGLVSGDYVMAEVFYAKTGDKVAYGVVRSTALNAFLPIFNVPPANANAYGININVPGKNKSMTVYLNGAFPDVGAYTADMTGALSMVSFETGGSTVPPSFQAVVRSTWGAPIDGARVQISQQSCGESGCVMTVNYENQTDVNGNVSFYGLPITTGTVDVRKAGYRSSHGYYSSFSTVTTFTNEYYLQLATYTLSGVLKYNGVPLPNARVMVWGDWNWWPNGSDSYRGNNGMQSELKVNTNYDGSFVIDGLTDGNVRLSAEFMGVWKELNQGNDYTTAGDDIRITISSYGAVGPVVSTDTLFNTPCSPGRVWMLEYSSGACISAGDVVFNINPESANSAGRLYGNITFVTTYTVTGAMPLSVPASSPVVVMAIQTCSGECERQKLGFASVSGLFTTNVASYTITLSSGVGYWSRIYSSEWGQISSHNDQAALISTDTVRMDFTVTRSGVLKGIVKMPDGSNFKRTNVYSANIEARGRNVESGQGTSADEFGAFEFPNLAPGRYNVYLKPQGTGFRWPPVQLEDVTVSAGRTTEVKLRLEEGLVVQPQIFGLPALSTAAWTYTVIGVPSGFQMNQANITDLFFEEPLYAFNYSSATASWAKKYMVPGQYDFYLVIGASYNPGESSDAGRVESYYQFANFIGQVKNVSIQKSDSNPSLGLYDQPIAINILGSIGQGQIGGRILGSKIFTASDYEKIFANFDSEIMPIIPAVMLYDTAGDLRGFGHALPDETAITGFEQGIKEKDESILLSALAANPLRYLVWGLPPGRYTAVFVNPNYPPVAKEIELPADESYSFNFDSENTVVGAISGVVKSSSTGEALENALVYLKHRTVEKFAKTSASGSFSFSNLPRGIYRMEVTRDGFVKTGQKTSLAGNDSAAFDFYLIPSDSKIAGKVYLSKFPSPSTKAGIKIVAYDETLNVAAPASYLPTLEAQTDEGGGYELNGVIIGHVYKVSAFYSGKTPETLDVEVINGETVVDDIVLRDIPPQITVKVRKSPDSARKVDVIIKSPKELVDTPVCKYNPGETFALSGAVSLALVPGPNNSYQGQFTVSSNKQYYTVNVAAGDGDNKMEKNILYDQTNDARTEQYIQDAAIAGGEIQMDSEKEEYSGLELDAGALTTSSGTADFSNLVGGFFSALPSVRTIKTAKGNATIESAIQNLMASEVYNMDLSNAQPNKPFTLTLKYDKERALNAGSLRIYQQDSVTGVWKELPGNYTVDPMSGVVSVDVSSLDYAYEGGGSADTPLGRKRFKMSAVKNGRYVPSASSTSQSGRFAVFTAKPGSGVAYAGSSYEVYNMPNPFNLKDKTVTISSDGGAAIAAGAYTVRGTIIKYHLPAGKSGDLKFVIYNLAGEKVRTIDEGVRGGGEVFYSEWDGKNDTNKDCASGVYLMLTYLDGKKLGNKAHKMAIIK